MIKYNNTQPMIYERDNRKMSVQESKREKDVILNLIRSRLKQQNSRYLSTQSKDQDVIIKFPKVVDKRPCNTSSVFIEFGEKTSNNLHQNYSKAEIQFNPSEFSKHSNKNISTDYFTNLEKISKELKTIKKDKSKRKRRTHQLYTEPSMYENYEYHSPNPLNSRVISIYHEQKPLKNKTLSTVEISKKEKKVMVNSHEIKNEQQQKIQDKKKKKLEKAEQVRKEEIKEEKQNYEVKKQAPLKKEPKIKILSFVKQKEIKNQKPEQFFPKIEENTIQKVSKKVQSRQKISPKLIVEENNETDQNSHTKSTQIKQSYQYRGGGTIQLLKEARGRANRLIDRLSRMAKKKHQQTD